MSQQSKNTLISEYKKALDAAEVARDRARVEESVARKTKERECSDLLHGHCQTAMAARRAHEYAVTILKRREADYDRAKQKYDAACNL